MGKMLWMRGVYTARQVVLILILIGEIIKNFLGVVFLMDQGIHMIDLFRYFATEEFNCLK